MIRTAATPSVMSASTMIGDFVRNLEDQEIGRIEDFMIDLDEGRIAYAVLSFGGIFGMGARLFAIPWQALTLDTDRKCFILDADKEKLKNAPGFDKDNWPDVADRRWGSGIYRHYGFTPYWEGKAS